MADVLLSSLVSSIMRSMNTLALKEFGIAWGLGTELNKLESTLSTIQAVLQDAQEKQWNSEAVRNWLRKLKDVAYDADEVVDEFATEALMRKVEREKGATSQLNIWVLTIPSHLSLQLVVKKYLRGQLCIGCSGYSRGNRTTTDFA
ncbi:disease resistance protein RGA2-like isoform X2 [Quercus robur]|uniref:disease resistance protein RGA2-like isoform X2 n=1 Tax=Quercus robur TaxID=38942 RepID=UPI0021626F24|nr:disease resistance protein RGA2-like isoform X2 [Quercus robur]